MRRKTRNVIIAIMTVLMINGVFASLAKEVQAASATIKLAALSENIQEGESFSVTVSITSTATIGEVSQQIRYDQEILKYQPEANGYEEKDGVITIADSNPSEKNQKYILKFKAIKQGAASVAISGTPTIYSSAGNILSVSKNTLSVNVGPKKGKSANRNLSSLSIKEGILKTPFKSILTEYEVSVGQEVKAVTVVAKPEHSGSKVEITGADKLLVGKNKVTIKVTSETNKSKEYILYVTRGMDGAVSMPQQPESTDALLTSPVPSTLPEEEQKEGVRVVEREGRLFFLGQEEHELLTLHNLRTLPKGYLSVALAIDNYAVDAYQLEDGSDKDIYLLYARHGQEEPCFYHYDSKEGTLQRYIEKPEETIGSDQLENVVQGDSSNDGISVDHYNKKVRELSTIIGVAAGLLVLFGMIAYHFYKKSKEY